MGSWFKRNYIPLYNLFLSKQRLRLTLGMRRGAVGAGLPSGAGAAGQRGSARGHGRGVLGGVVPLLAAVPAPAVTVGGQGVMVHLTGAPRYHRRTQVGLQRTYRVGLITYNSESLFGYF